MKLTFKLLAAFVVGNVLLAVGYGYLAVQREVRLFHEAAIAEAQTVGNTLQGVLADALRRRGEPAVLDVLQRTEGGEQHTRVRWVWFDEAPGSEFGPAAGPDRLTSLAIERHQAIDDSEPSGTQYVRVYWPVATGAPRRGGLEFSRPMAELDEHTRDIVWRTTLLVGGMVVLSGLLTLVLGVRMVGRPLRQLIEKTRRIAAGDLTQPVSLPPGDELAELGASLNEMCDQLAGSHRRIREEAAARVAATDQLRHADRLTTVGRLASGIAHELGTPLNVVSGRAQLIASGRLSAQEVAESASAIKAEAEKMTQIIRQLLDFARAGTAHKVPVDLRQVVAQTVDMLGAVAERRRVELRVDTPPEPAAAEADAAQVQQVFTNLIVNAAQAMPSGGPVDIALRRQVASPPGADRDAQRAFWAVEFRDRGCGISEENLPHLFEPFFTTKGTGEGTGLGLSIAYGIVQDHGGWIDVDARPGAGSCFTVYLPEGAKP